MKKVLLLSPFFQNEDYPLYLPSENLGLGYLAAYLRHHGVDVDIIDANMEELYANSLISKISNIHDYSVIGISITFQLIFSEVTNIAKEIKMKNKNIHLTVGGHFATFKHLEIMESDINIDSVIRGDGEQSLLELVLALDIGKDLGLIKGLTYRNAFNEIIINESRPLLEDINTLPWPARDTLSKTNHSCPTQITSSRGCYGNCSFCDIRAFYGAKWRARNYIDVVDEMESLNKNYGSKVFRFTDDEFIGPKPMGPQRAINIANEIIKRSLDIELLIAARANIVEYDLFKVLKEAGVKECLIGIESGVDRILKLYNKKMTVEDNLKAINTLKSLGINLNIAYIMFDPRMTFDELKQNYMFLKQNDLITIDSLRSWLWALSGTPLIKQLYESNLVISEGINTLNYQFADADVYNVFILIKKIEKHTFEIEKTIFDINKNKAVRNLDISKEQAMYKELWIYIFEGLLADYTHFNFDSMSKQCEYILKALLEKIEQ